MTADVSRILFSLALVFFLGAAPTLDSMAVLEAKRRAAMDLQREGKTAEAVALLSEVINSGQASYRDHLFLGRAYDKLNKTPEAAAAYRRASELLTSLDTQEDRTARGEIDRRLKVLDAQIMKVAAQEEEFLKKLDLLEREVAKDPVAMGRLLRLRAEIYKAQQRRDRTGYIVLAPVTWQISGMEVIAGRTYRIRAAGTCQLTPQVECAPEGTTRLEPNFQGPRGLLIARIGEGTFFPVGSGIRFKASETGPLRFLVNHSAATVPLGGAYTVTIEEQGTFPAQAN